MCRGRPLFPGTSDEDQLKRIFKALGTPTTEIYPGIVELPEWNPTSPLLRPVCKARPWAELVPGYDEDALDLLSKMLVYDPADRIGCDDALSHRYFATLPDSVRLMVGGAQSGHDAAAKVFTAGGGGGGGGGAAASGGAASGGGGGGGAK
jgi:serine/threonine protein kinase